MTKKTLILYYSWSGNTEKTAKKIQEEIAASDLKQVKVPAGTFDRDMYKTNDIALEQIQNNDFPDIELDSIDFNKYDLVIIGSPIWSGYPATPIKTLLEQMKGYQGEVASFFTSARANRQSYINHFKDWAQDFHVIGVAEEDSQVKEWLK